MSSTTVFVNNLMFGLRSGAVEHDLRGAKILAPVHQGDSPKRVRKFASSMAESPPPTTMIFCPYKKSRRRWRRN